MMFGGRPLHEVIALAGTVRLTSSQSRGTAISRSVRMAFFPFPLCRTSSTPMILHLSTRPGAVVASCKTRASIASPSSPLVDGMNPQSYG